MVCPTSKLSATVKALDCEYFAVCPDHLYQCDYGRIDGLKPGCITNEQRCDGVIDCNGGDDEMDHNCPCTPEGAVRLVGGIVPYRGRVEHCVNKRWLSQCYSETSLSGHSVRRPPLYRGHLCKSPMLLFPYIFTSVKRAPHYKGQFCMALCDRYKEVSLYYSWGRSDSAVLCRQLGYPSEG